MVTQITFLRQTKVNGKLQCEGLDQNWELFSPCRCHVSKNSGYIIILLHATFKLYNTTPENLFKWIVGYVHVFLASHLSPSNFDVGQAMKWYAKHFAILWPINGVASSYKEKVTRNNQSNKLKSMVNTTQIPLNTKYVFI